MDLDEEAIAGVYEIERRLPIARIEDALAAEDPALIDAGAIVGERRTALGQRLKNIQGKLQGVVNRKAERGGRDFLLVSSIIPHAPVFAPPRAQAAVAGDAHSSKGRLGGLRCTRDRGREAPPSTAQGW